MAAQPKLFLFSSSTSQKSLHAEELVRKFIPNARIVRLDTKEQRDRAARGKVFSIEEVPTLVAHHPNNKIDLWNGIQKITQLLTPADGRAEGRPEGRPRDQESSRRRRSNNMYDNEPLERGRRRHEESSELSDESADEAPNPSRSRSRPKFEESSDSEPEPAKPKRKVRIVEPEKESPTAKKKEREKMARAKLDQAKKGVSEPRESRTL